MRFYKIFLLVFITTFVIHAHAQKQSFGAGVSLGTFAYHSPGISTTPYLFYRYNNHELLAGMELFGGNRGFASIRGVEAEYRYHFLNYGKHSNLFVDCNFQYVRFGSGPVQNVPFHYHYTSSPGLDYSMVLNRSFNNTIGIGVQYNFWKICFLYFNSGIGYVHYRNTLSPWTDSSFVNPDYIGTGFDFSFMFKFGLSIKIISNKKSS